MELKRRKKYLETFDIWDGENELGKPAKIHPSLKRKQKNPLPHPGQSYNPDPEEHKKLLEKVMKKELVELKKKKSLREIFDDKVDPSELRKAEREELVSGIKYLIKDGSSNGANSKHNQDDSESSSTDDAFSDYDDKDFSAILKDKRVEEKRKSKQQRLRQLKDRLQRKAAKLKKLKNIRLSKFDAIKKINKELDKREKEEAKKKKKHKKIKNERLGQKFEPSDPIYCLSKELPSNLRKTSCPMDAIVREQLESFQSRLFVEPTKFQVKKRKYKKREFDRKATAEE